MLPNACPKPPKSKESRPVSLKHGKPLKRSRMRNGAGSKRRGKSSFPKQRDRKYRRWVWTENPCMLAGRLTRGAVSSYDAPYESLNHSAARVYRGFWHNCWGGNTPAHVGKHQATGAPDFGVLVPLCKVAHGFYDEHRKEWVQATGFTEKKMALRASGYALKYVEQGGAAVRAAGGTP